MQMVVVGTGDVVGPGIRFWHLRDANERTTIADHQCSRSAFGLDHLSNFTRIWFAQRRPLLGCLAKLEERGCVGPNGAQRE
jgi:hypothetical protein